MIQIPNVTLDAESHIYTHVSGSQYVSNSKFCNYFIEDFDSSIIHYAAKKEGKSVEELQAEWDTTRDLATDTGTLGHKVQEDFLKGKPVDKNNPFYEDAVFTHSIMKQYKRYFSEEILYNEKLKLATMVDLIGQRTKSAKSIYDFGDIKYNAKKFSYDSSRVKHGIRKQYNKFFLPPLSHLEYCYYTKTCIQISFAMYLAELAGLRIGKGFIILCDWQVKDEVVMPPMYLPVPYMKNEIETMVKSYNHEDAAF